MDSSGLGLIMGRFNTMKEIGGSVTVADPNPGIERIMSLAGLERIVKVVHTSLKKTAEKREEAAAVMKSEGFFESKKEPVTRKDEKNQRKRGIRK